MVTVDFPVSLNVRTLAGSGVSDERVWELAIEHSCLLVSKDQDFHRLHGPHRHVPQVHRQRARARPV
ncbi:DUF5615 family PIN-like protein [Propionicimonas sp.]|uniref:DUF5615 family PIN-like protein n=1 Tax=Propionicimonas sp. TaxID=1955623 RepID=UPI0039C9C1A5